MDSDGRRRQRVGTHLLTGYRCYYGMHYTEMADPTNPRHGLKPALRLTAFLGVCGGFMMAYQRSSCEYCFRYELLRLSLPALL